MRGAKCDCAGMPQAMSMGRSVYGNMPSPGIAMHHSSAAAGTLGLCLQNSGGHVIVDNVDPSSPNAAAVCIPAGEIWFY